MIGRTLRMLFPAHWMGRSLALVGIAAAVLAPPAFAGAETTPPVVLPRFNVFESVLKVTVFIEYFEIQHRTRLRHPDDRGHRETSVDCRTGGIEIWHGNRGHSGSARRRPHASRGGTVAGATRARFRCSSGKESAVVEATGRNPASRTGPGGLGPLGRRGGGAFGAAKIPKPEEENGTSDATKKSSPPCR